MPAPQTNTLNLTASQFEELESAHPDSGSSGAVKGRAEAIARIYLEQTYPGATFVSPEKGGDIAVQHAGSTTTFEVKGTRGRGLQFAQLKVSSEHSYKLLRSDAPMLRISEVFTKTPKITVLVYSQHFDLKPEPRWSVHPK